MRMVPECWVEQFYRRHIERAGQSSLMMIVSLSTVPSEASTVIVYFCWLPGCPHW